MRRPLLLLLALAALSPASATPTQDLVSAARAQIGITLHYDPSYQRLAYPKGDVPRERGVCTDVVIPPTASSASTCKSWYMKTCARNGS